MFFAWFGLGGGGGAGRLRRTVEKGKCFEKDIVFFMATVGEEIGRCFLVGGSISSPTTWVGCSF